MTEITARLSTALADRYKIERHLGEGGMATVYLAEDLKHKRKVAVKVLRPELAAILGAERFLKEIEVTASLQHPNILPLYDSGEADTFLYYVMPHIEGESLRDKLNREKQLGVEETVEIAKSVAGALSFAHARGVIHRDIKPDNILLQSGQALVADFVRLAPIESCYDRLLRHPVNLSKACVRAHATKIGLDYVAHELLCTCDELRAIVYTRRYLPNCSRRRRPHPLRHLPTVTTYVAERSPR